MDGLPDIGSVLTSTGSALGGAGLIGAFMRWAKSKEAEAVTTDLALIKQQLAQLVESSRKHEGMAERVALLEQSVRALHDRLDGVRKKR